MTALIVDDLKMIQIEKRQRVHVTAAPSERNGLGEDFLKLAAIKQTGQRVVRRIERQLFGAFLLIGDIAQNDDETIVEAADRRADVGNMAWLIAVSEDRLPADRFTRRLGGGDKIDRVLVIVDERHDVLYRFSVSGSRIDRQHRARRRV